MLNACLSLSLMVALQSPRVQAKQAVQTQPVDFPSHPFVMVNRQELDRLAKAIARPGRKANLYRTPRGNAFASRGFGIRTNADDWLHRDIEIPAHGGHYHHFFCEDGDLLTIPDGQRFAPGPYRCPKCGRTYSGERYEAALRRIVHMWVSSAAWDLAMVYALEHKPEYAAKSAEILLKYAAAYPGPHTSPTEGGMIYQSLDESMWVIPLAQAYDLIYDQLSPEQRTTIESFLATVAEGVQRCGTRGNWGSWHLSAVGVVGYAIHSRELVDWATQQFRLQIRDQLGDDGLWPESVHTYHYFPLQAFVAFAEAAAHAGEDLYHWEAKPGKSLMSMFTAPLEYAYPDLRLPAINDGWFNAWLPADLYEIAWYRQHDPRFAWVLSRLYQRSGTPAGSTSEKMPKRSGLYAFLFSEDLPADPPAPVFQSTNFPVLGICTLRSPRGVMATFDYGPFLGHGQLDKMGITLFANEQLWAADYGTPGYGAKILPWYNSTFAHNTVVVDGKDQARTKENAAELWLDESEFQAVRSTTKESYPGVTYTRTVVRIDDYFVISDVLSSDAPHTYDFCLHSEGSFALDDAGAATDAGTPSKWIKDVHAHPARKSVRAEWRNTQSGLALVQIGSGELTPIAAMCPAETGSRSVAMLMTRQQGASARFDTVLVPFTAAIDLQLQRAGDALEIQHGSHRDVLHLLPNTRPTLVRK